jgi:XRE family transcriptional regulator, regulator of sulfur utilization
MKKIGERIRFRREHKAMHLNELAKKVGVTKSCLSQIENGKSYPSIITLKKIADALNTTIGDLVGEKERLAFHPLITLEERKFVTKNETGASLFLLSHHDPNKQMETYFVQFESGSDSHGLLENHQGQAFCYTINGKIEIVLENQVYILKKGDCFYYNSLREHSIKNIDEGISRMIWVIAHPNL